MLPGVCQKRPFRFEAVTRVTRVAVINLGYDVITLGEPHAEYAVVLAAGQTLQFNRLRDLRGPTQSHGRIQKFTFCDHGHQLCPKRA